MDTQNWKLFFSCLAMLNNNYQEMGKRGCSHEKHLLRQKIKVQKDATVFKNAFLITFSPSL